MKLFTRARLKQVLHDAEYYIRIAHPGPDCKGVADCDCQWAKVWRDAYYRLQSLPAEPPPY